eukprot:TRINITY_DN27505_c0_g1_i3.p1 TRINITY_DN27505_c0_g1~~TRINITY_DN27505_c0_g1_i3.p1  ORF type:complete len:138 (+),score=3.44 TRINITY_DN27505_c0_g1_i3:76-489(+)
MLELQMVNVSEIVITWLQEIYSTDFPFLDSVLCPECIDHNTMSWCDCKPTIHCEAWYATTQSELKIPHTKHTTYKPASSGSFSGSSASTFASVTSMSAAASRSASAFPGSACAISSSSAGAAAWACLLYTSPSPRDS